MINIARETLVFRRGGISPPLSLLVPTFDFPDAPERVNPFLQGGWNAPLPILTDSTASVSGFIPDYYPRAVPRPVSCYALFE